MNSVVCRYRDEVDREPFRFNISGLDNIYLLSGYELHNTKHGPAVSFADTDGLNRALGRYLANQRRGLTGREWLFLRVEMDVSQVELGRLLHISAQQVVRAGRRRSARYLVPRTSCFAACTCSTSEIRSTCEGFPNESGEARPRIGIRQWLMVRRTGSCCGRRSFGGG